MEIGHFYMCRVYSTASLRGTLMFQLMQRAGIFSGYAGVSLL